MNDVERMLTKAAWRGRSHLSDRAAAGFAERASREGLVEVAYSKVDSPIGKLVLFATPRGLVRVLFPDESLNDAVEQLAERISPALLEAPSKLDGARRELDEYFDGRRHDFDIPLDWSLTSGFKQRVLKATARIPYGKVATYTEMANKAGSPRGARAAGNALGSNPIPIVVPCHRVLHSGGGLGGYGGGLPVKQKLLRLEGALK